MNFHRRLAGNDRLPPQRDTEFVDVSEEWIQLGSDWLSNVFPSFKSHSEGEGRSDDKDIPRRLKH